LAELADGIHLLRRVTATVSLPFACGFAIQVFD